MIVLQSVHNFYILAVVYIEMDDCIAESCENTESTLLSISRPHRSIMNVAAACCYGWSSMVCQLVLSVTIVSPAKRLDQSRYHLGCGLWWALETMY